LVGSCSSGTLPASPRHHQVLEPNSFEFKKNENERKWMPKKIKQKRGESLRGGLCSRREMSPISDL
jgi:hypothetical protein